MAKNSRTRWRPAILTMLGILLVPVLSYVGWVAATPAGIPDEQCSGFGCNSGARDWLIYYGVLVGIPVIAGTVILGSATVAALLKWTRLPGALTGFVGACMGMLTSAVAVILYSAEL